MFEKIKWLLAHFQAPQRPTLSQSNDFGIKIMEPKVPSISNDLEKPITNKIVTWIDTKKWVYSHRSLDKGDIHHLMLGFCSDDTEWVCAFCINEKIKVVTVFGILEDSVPIPYYTAVLMELTKANLDLAFGNFEFDPDDGEVRVKITFDVEFGMMTYEALDYYFQLLSKLTGQARMLVDRVLKDTKPSHFVGDYIDGYNVDNEIRVMVDEERRTVLMPTTVAQ